MFHSFFNTHVPKKTTSEEPLCVRVEGVGGLWWQRLVCTWWWQEQGWQESEAGGTAAERGTDSSQQCPVAALRFQAGSLPELPTTCPAAWLCPPLPATEGPSLMAPGPCAGRTVLKSLKITSRLPGGTPFPRAWEIGQSCGMPSTGPQQTGPMDTPAHLRVCMHAHSLSHWVKRGHLGPSAHLLDGPAVASSDPL